MRHDRIARHGRENSAEVSALESGHADRLQGQGAADEAAHLMHAPLARGAFSLSADSRWTRRAWQRALLRQGFLVLILAAIGLLLRDRIAALDIPAILAAFGTVTAPQWGLAALATGVSYWSLGQYDVVIHHMLKTGIAPRVAARTGIIAIAISQTVGIGLISGALVRWRMNAGLSLVSASKITAIVAASFLLGWATVTGAVVLTLPIDTANEAAGDALPSGFGALLRGLGTLGLALGLLAFTLPQMTTGLRLFGRSLLLPPSRLVAKILTLAALDTLAAGGALWALLPPGAGPEFAVLLPAFLLALGAGFVAGTPGGIGPFEITLLALLPLSDQTPVLAAVLAWRGIYFALPATLAAGALLRFVLGPAPKAPARSNALASIAPEAFGPAVGLPLPHRASDTPSDTAHRPALNLAIAPPAVELTPRLAALIERAPRAELGLLRQGEHEVLLAGNARAGWMLGRAGRVLVGLLDPFGTPERGLTQAFLPRLTALARQTGRIACLYKITSRTAASARAMGWRVLPVAQEAWLAPQSFTLDIPARAALRRKLRKAQTAGLRVTCGESALPIAEMTALSASWVTARGGERGFSMGRYTPEYVSGQRVYLAHQGEKLVAFATFHMGAREWVLDLMRPDAQAPDGTMHTLIARAVKDARDFGIARLSLAALTPEPDSARGIAAQIWKRAAAQNGAAGLRQFKATFAPEWQTLYLAAPNTAAITLAAASIANAIRRPPLLTRDKRRRKAGQVRLRESGV